MQTQIYLLIWISLFTRVWYKMLDICMWVTKNLRHVFTESSFKIVSRTACLSFIFWQFILKIMKTWISWVYLCEKLYMCVCVYIYLYVYMNGLLLPRSPVCSGCTVVCCCTPECLFYLCLSQFFHLTHLYAYRKKIVNAFGRNSYPRPCWAISWCLSTSVML